MPVTNPANLQGSDHIYNTLIYTFTIYKDQTTWLWGSGGSAGYMAGGWKISESILQSTMLKLRQRAWLMTIFVVVFLYLYVYTFVFSIFHSASFCAESRSSRLAGGVAWVFAFTICNFILAFPCIFISVCMYLYFPYCRVQSRSDRLAGGVSWAAIWRVWGVIWTQPELHPTLLVPYQPSS